jgi:hypothetical protein
MHYKPHETSHTYWSENSTCLSLISPQGFYSLRLNEASQAVFLLLHDCYEVAGSIGYIIAVAIIHLISCKLCSYPPIGPPSILVLFGS